MDAPKIINVTDITVKFKDSIFYKKSRVYNFINPDKTELKTDALNNINHKSNMYVYSTLCNSKAFQYV